jgi:hypothetical protein
MYHFVQLDELEYFVILHYACEAMKDSRIVFI